MPRFFHLLSPRRKSFLPRLEYKLTAGLWTSLGKNHFLLVEYLKNSELSRCNPHRRHSELLENLSHRTPVQILSFPAGAMRAEVVGLKTELDRFMKGSYSMVVWKRRAVN